MKSNLALLMIPVLPILVVLSFIGVSCSTKPSIQKPAPSAVGQERGLTELLEFARVQESGGKFDDAIRSNEEILARFAGESSTQDDRSFGELAQDNIKRLRCLKRRGPTSAKRLTLSELRRGLIRALNRIDHKRLMKFASCSFLVGPTDSEGFFVEPSTVIPELLGAIKKVKKWDTGDYDDESQARLQSEDGGTRHHLLLKKENKLGWIWYGYATGDPEVRDRIFEKTGLLIAPSPIPSPAPSPIPSPAPSPIPSPVPSPSPSESPSPPIPSPNA
ncbi:MAG: hypothetical protein A2603_06025 [Bdellovibrionales bacterium RIFOXYD1_FULL_55_31]|nr:MAG: hypothetical protein A2603_06025 [Bdellovibrionales bacterium RIFOXYD1_FULL_55_31]